MRGFAEAADRYDAFLLDLDGVLYRGDAEVPGAAKTVAVLRQRGRRVVFVTNNSSRTPEQVAAKLDGLGIPAAPGDVVTSGVATAAMLRGEARSAFVIGEEGLRAALADAGIEVVAGEPREADAVVIGWDRAAGYEELRVATMLVRRGARLVATNTDATYPAPGGELWPGAGALVAAVETATGVRAEAVGKPQRALLDAAVDRAGTRRALVVGDRVETDVAGAEAAGLDAALVFSGAAAPATLLEHDARPVVAMEDVRGLLEARPLARIRTADGAQDLAAARGLARDAGLAAEGEAGEALLAEDDGEAVATASVAVRGEDAYLHSVAVREDVHGLHVGTLAAAGAVRRAVASGAERVLLVTEGAARFFARLGFREVARKRLPGWVAALSAACSAAAVAMAWDAPVAGPTAATPTAR